MGAPTKPDHCGECRAFSAELLGTPPNVYNCKPFKLLRKASQSACHSDRAKCRKPPKPAQPQLKGWADPDVMAESKREDAARDGRTWP